MLPETPATRPTKHPASQTSASKSRTQIAFTLIELLVVISIIAVLIGLAFPAFQAVQNSAKKTQAKNDLTQIVTAVNAFYTEYGKYPLPAGAAADSYQSGGNSGTSTKIIFDALRGTEAPPTLNPRQIVFTNLPEAKDQTNPRNGVKTADGQLYDPWGRAYWLAIDSDYDNQVPNPYSSGAGSAEIRAGVIGYSLGKDQAGGTGNKNAATSKDDVISWQ